ncbi:hypothetical protein BZL29_7468 [Mycobacterium kansasii]|uniref:Uncharacterized protein n=1 Tax=Mycobacterium kansasii TaxID=1768 RepID=A0A1V3WGK1_MYCKA|nr:hypothetical protein BZL29_7468 [Mycobacterium kansasii]
MRIGGAGLACPGMLAVAVLLWMGALCVYDVRQRRLPNALTVPGPR